ncbi:MAG: LysR substrate-binding domain-containing protein [Amphritea sp.]
MNLRQIEAFRAVMVTGSGTEAAKMLFITQPAVSRLIADLEYQSNLKLFIRKPNRLEPTPEAQALFREVDRAFMGLEEIRLFADAIVNKQQGSLRIVAMPVCVDSFLPPLIAEFLKQHPKVSIELESAPRTQALDLVRTQRLDLGIISLARREDVGLQVQNFCRQQAVCVLPADHPLCDKPEIHVHDLENEPFISVSSGSPFRARFDEIFAREGIKRSFAIETRTQRTVYELVKRGAGVAILDPFITDNQDSDVVIKPFLPEVTWDYAVVQPHSASPSLITQSFIELLMTNFST